MYHKHHLNYLNAVCRNATWFLEK